MTEEYAAMRAAAHAALDLVMDDVLTGIIEARAELIEPEVAFRCVLALDPEHGDHDWEEYSAQLVELPDGTWISDPPCPR